MGAVRDRSNVPGGHPDIKYRCRCRDRFPDEQISRGRRDCGVKPGKDVGEVKKAKDDGRLPMADHNTHIMVFGRDGAQAKALAEAIAREAFHNVSYFAGPLERLQTAAVR
jgi:hypothetical protein